MAIIQWFFYVQNIKFHLCLLLLEEFKELKEILNSFDGLEKDYNWLLTDLEWEWSNTDKHIDYFEDYRIFKESNNSLNNYWITGENLTKLANNKEVYFIWGVFSAFEKNEIIDLDEIKEEPFADGNTNFWVEDLSKDNDLSKIFRNNFEGWKDLNSYNQS